ncbi:Heterokaryon incompatibility protein 6, OR allele [Fusarium austroafricanum]|uniref:Heterokaryon incompatibility protein 6, OR allele n=1 Tax=Fusarium austroafricanum TaxID=2364996 RepID=A0A8H4NX98_9HYPO|nr:Heterokaryon incompatibility protein 6, OR allele [Fusarium austroafricanum]
MDEIFSTPNNENFYAKFSYDDLDPDSRQIRLIRIGKELSEDMIQCEFLPLQGLDQAQGSYYTLSYCAGSPLKQRQILLNGLIFNVFDNLGHALLQILDFWKSEKLEEDCILWIDQICINQRNIAERSHQVGLMRDIYSNTRQTFICLSTPNDRRSAASNGLHLINQIDRCLRQGWEGIADHEDHPYNDDNPRLEVFPRLEHFLVFNNHTRPGQYTSYKDSDYRVDGARIGLQNVLTRGSMAPCSFSSLLTEVDKASIEAYDLWNSFYDLVESPWWRRAWIHQEFICSPEVAFMYHYSYVQGTSTQAISFLCSEFEDLQHWNWGKLTRGVPERARLSAVDIRKRNTRLRSDLTAIKSLTKTKEIWKGEEDLKEILIQFRHCKSSDPRDKIFAFLGLARPCYGINVDYSKENTMEAVMIDTAKNIFMCDRNLDILLYTIRTKGSLQLPSWVPDWTSTTTLVNGRFSELPVDFQHFQYDDINLRVAQSINKHDWTLRVQGLQIGSLQNRRQISDWYAAFDIEPDQGGVRCRSSAQEGDELWLLLGAKYPFVLRKNSEGHTIVSEADSTSMLGRLASRICAGQEVAQEIVLH